MYQLKKIVFILLTVSFIVTYAQEENLKWLEESYDYGTVNEKGGQVNHKFYFVNEYKKAVKILNVRASCGCTTPSWIGKPVFPGDTGFVEAKYNPDNRPGNFNKTLTVFLENSEYQKELYIKGYVQPPLQNPAKSFSQTIGNLRFKNLNFNMGVVQKDKPAEQIFNVFNNSLDTLTFTNNNAQGKHLNIIYEPVSILPQQIGNIRITYNAADFEGFGLQKEELTLLTNDKLEPIKKVKLNANIREFFTDSMKNDPNRPILKLEYVDKYLGNIEEGNKQEIEFSYTNIGNSILYIRDEYTSCDCLAYKEKLNKVKPGKKVVVKLIFDTTGKSSYVQNVFTIVSNDPKNPVQTVTFRSKVTPKTSK